MLGKWRLWEWATSFESTYLNQISSPTPQSSICFCRFFENEGREIRTPNLLIWSQTRYRCAIPPLELHARHSSSRRISTQVQSEKLTSPHKRIARWGHHNIWREVATVTRYSYPNPMKMTRNMACLDIIHEVAGNKQSWFFVDLWPKFWLKQLLRIFFHMNAFHTYFAPMPMSCPTVSIQRHNIHTKITLRIFIDLRPKLW